MRKIYQILTTYFKKCSSILTTLAQLVIQTFLAVTSLFEKTRYWQCPWITTDVFGILWNLSLCSVTWLFKNQVGSVWRQSNDGLLEVLGSSLSQDIEYPDWSYSWFPSVCPGKCQDGTSIRPQPLIYKSFQILYSLSVVPFVAIWSEVLTGL